MKKEKVECRFCHGTGKKTWGNSSPCPKCDGTGDIPTFFSGMKVCSKCDGTGEIVRSYTEDCEECNGRGTRIVDREIGEF